MKTSQLAPNEAVLVNTVGTIEVAENEQVLVGIKCIYRNGRYEPITPGFALTKNIFDYCEKGELVVIKRLLNPQT